MNNSLVSYVVIMMDNCDLFDCIVVDVFDDDIDVDKLDFFLFLLLYCLLVGVVDDQVVGQCFGIMIYVVDWWLLLLIENFGVSFDYCRWGIVCDLIDQMCVWVIDLGVEYMWFGFDFESDIVEVFYCGIGLLM